MALTISSPLEFRPAYADEIERCSFIDAQTPWNLPDTRWYVAVRETPLERIVAVIRYWIGWPAGEGASPAITFRISCGPGGEAETHLEPLIHGFLAFLDPHGVATVRYEDQLLKGSPLEEPLRNNAFRSVYRQYHLRVDYSDMVKRISPIIKKLGRRKTHWNEARIVPTRLCRLEHALPLILRFNLMAEKELRRIWHSPDPATLDRDASACLFLGDEAVGVILAIDSGEDLRIPAIAMDERIPGARQCGNALLMNHVIRTRKDAGYRFFVFRANPENARQTLNMALRVGGEITGEARRWERSPDAEQDTLIE